MDTTILIVVLAVVAVAVVVVIKTKPPEPKSNLTDAIGTIGKIISAF